MKKNIKISVIVLNWNSYADTVECIKSILKQTYENLEIIIVDNNSQDNSFKKLQEDFHTAHFIKSSSNAGYARGNNLGIKKAIEIKSNYILLANADLVLDEKACEIAIDCFESNNKIAVLGGKVYYYNSDKIWSAGGNFNSFTGKSSGIGHNEKDSDYINKNKSVDYIPGAALFIRLEVIEKIGYLPEEYFLGGEEVDFAFNAKKNNYDIIFNHRIISYHKVGYSNNKSIMYKYNRLRNRLIFFDRNHKFIKKNICLFLFYSRYIFLEIILSLFRKKNYIKILFFVLRDHKKNKKVFESDLLKIKKIYENK